MSPALRLQPLFTLATEHVYLFGMILKTRDCLLRFIAQLTLIMQMQLVRFEILTAVTMKNAVFWDTRSQFIPHTKHITP
jgi:hypothetical protein